MSSEYETQLETARWGVGQMRAGKLQTAAGALIAGAALNAIKGLDAYGLLDDAVAALGVQRNAASRWMRIAAAGLDAESVLAMGGIKRAAQALLDAERENAVSQDEGVFVSPGYKLPPTPEYSVPEDDGAQLQTPMPSAEWEGPPDADSITESNTVAEVLADTFDAMATPVRKPSKAEGLEAQVMLLEEENLLLAESVRLLTAEVAAFRNENPDKAAQWKAMVSEGKAHEKQAAYWRAQYNELKGKHDGAIARLREMQGDNN